MTVGLTGAIELVTVEVGAVEIGGTGAKTAWTRVGEGARRAAKFGWVSISGRAVTTDAGAASTGLVTYREGESAAANLRPSVAGAAARAAAGTQVIPLPSTDRCRTPGRETDAAVGESRVVTASHWDTAADGRGVRDAAARGSGAGLMTPRLVARKILGAAARSARCSAACSVAVAAAIAVAVGSVSRRVGVSRSSADSCAAARADAPTGGATKVLGRLASTPISPPSLPRMGLDTGVDATRRIVGAPVTGPGAPGTAAVRSPGRVEAGGDT